ncbi:MAG: hypothetical protein Q7J48_09620 [Nocardioides sp.]|nr:hypothetical protein [Nocardioides sp.]
MGAAPPTRCAARRCGPARPPRDGVWFEEPHDVALLDDDGEPVRHSARLAGHTLIWQDRDVTLRLEGDVSLERAVKIAESTVPTG